MRNQKSRRSCCKYCFGLVIQQGFSLGRDGVGRFVENLHQIVQPTENYLNSHKIPFMKEVGKYYFINLDQEWEDVRKGMSKSYVYRNWKLAINRINRSGGNYEIEYNPKLTAQQILERSKHIHIKRQEFLGRKSNFLQDNYSLFAGELINYNLEIEEFQSYWLKYNNNVIAYLLGFYKNQVFYLWATAFLPEYESFYPGRLMQYEVVKFMCQNGFKEYNFMRGESSYKQKWSKTNRTNNRFRIYNNKNLYSLFINKLRTKK